MRNEKMNDSPPLIDTYSRSDFFEGITKINRTEIINRGHRILFEAGAIIFREGEPAQKCYYVLDGRLKLTKLHEQGKEAIIRYVNAEEITAAIAVLKGKEYPITAQAVGTTNVIWWDKETILKLMLEYPPLAVNTLRTVIERIDDLQTRYLEFVAEQVEQRIARALLRIMKQSGRKTNEGILIDFRLSRQDLANYTGTTLYTVSRALSGWEKKGWVQSGRERITVTDPHALVLFSEKG